MSQRLRFLSLAVGLGPALVPVTAHAFALGDVAYQSAIGEPLRVELALSGADADQAGDCMRLISRRGSDPGIVYIRNARLTVSNAHGRARLVLTSAEHGDAIVRFALVNTCSSFSREYTLLLSPPSVAPRTVASPTPYTAPAPAPRPAPAPQPPRRPRYDSWRTSGNESLASIADSLYPDSASRREHFISRTLQANPRMFRDGVDAETALPAGARLRVPSGTERRHEHLQRQAASTPPQEQTAPRHPAAEPLTPQTHRDQLLLQRNTPAQASTPGNGNVQQQAYSAREQQLLDSLSNVISAQRQLDERVAQLEAIQKKLMEQVARLQAEGSIPAALPPPLPKNAEAESRWQMPLFLLGGIGVAGLLVWLRRRYNHSDRTLDELAPATGSTPPPQAAEPVAVPPLARASAKTGMATAQSAPAETAPAADDDDTPLIEAEENLEVAEHDSAIELADIMMSFGRVQGAAETLADFIRANPKRAITPWLKLLEVYRTANMRTEFEALSRQLNKTFNVMVVSWDHFDEDRKSAEQSVEQMPHIMNNLTKLWPSRECQIYLNTLIRDNRDGTRQGFPLGLIDDLLMLSGVLDIILGPLRSEPATAAANAG